MKNYILVLFCVLSIVVVGCSKYNPPSMGPEDFTGDIDSEKYIIVDKSEIPKELHIGDTFTLKAKSTLEDFELCYGYWGDKDIVDVDYETGVVTCVGVGKTQVYVSYNTSMEVVPMIMIDIEVEK